MTKFKVDKFKQVKKSWIETIIDRIGEGRVLPLIGNRVNTNLIFGSHDELVEGFGASFDLPTGEEAGTGFFRDRQNLSLMTQYLSVMKKADPDLKADHFVIKTLFLDFLEAALSSIADDELLEELKEDVGGDKLSFSEIALRLEHPSFSNGQENPLLLLADLPLPVYLTTSYHNLMEAALEKNGKSPRSEFCRWSKNLEGLPSVFKDDPSYEPSIDEPLVYHLYGTDEYPDSMVLTEDDHLDFLVTVSANNNAIAPRVRQALADSALLMLGYSLRSWDFRVLFRGLIKTSQTERRPRSVSIQLSEDEFEKNYLKNYLAQEGKFEVFWGDTLQFIQKLHQGWSQ